MDTKNGDGDAALRQRINNLRKRGQCYLLLDNCAGIVGEIIETGDLSISALASYFQDRLWGLLHDYPALKLLLIWTGKETNWPLPSKA